MGGSRAADGTDNLAPFSYFMGVSTRPPSIAISVARGRKGVLKDTASNILETEVFTVSMVSHRLVTPMVQTSLPEGPEVSEFRANGLEAVEGDLVNAPARRKLWPRWSVGWSTPTTCSPPTSW